MKRRPRSGIRCSTPMPLWSLVIRAGAADAMEGFNPTHDLCRYLANAAILIAERESRHRIANFDFPLVGLPDTAPAGLRDRCVRFALDERALARKRAAAENYPEM